MKGLLLNSAVQNKTYYIVTLCEFVAFMALIIGIFGNFSSNPDVMGVAILIPYLGMLFIPITLSEGISGRKTQKMLECGFLKYTLTSGVSKAKYATTETVESLIYMVIASVLNIIIFWTAGLLAPEIVPPAEDYIRIILLFSLFAGSFNAVVNTLTLFVKNHEIAGLLVGCVLGFAVAIVMGIQNIKGEHLVITVDTTFTVIVTLICLALYAISTFVMALRLERYSG